MTKQEKKLRAQIDISGKKLVKDSAMIHQISAELENLYQLQCYCRNDEIGEQLNNFIMGVEQKLRNSRSARSNFIVHITKLLCKECGSNSTLLAAYLSEWSRWTQGMDQKLSYDNHIG